MSIRCLIAVAVTCGSTACVSFPDAEDSDAAVPISDASAPDSAAPSPCDEEGHRYVAGDWDVADIRLRWDESNDRLLTAWTDADDDADDDEEADTALRFALIDGETLRVDGRIEDVRPMGATGDAESYDVELVSDGYVFAWEIETGANEDRAAIRIRHFGRDGRSSLPMPAELVRDAAAIARAPALSWNGEVLGVAWRDDTEDNGGAAFRTADGHGRVTEEAPMVVLPGERPAIAWGAETWLVAAAREIGDERYQLQAVRIDDLGRIRGSRLDLGDTSTDVIDAEIAWSDASERFAVVWTARSDDESSVRVACVTADGEVDGDVRVVSGAGGRAFGAQIVGDDDGFAVVWTGGPGDLQAGNEGGDREIRFRQLKGNCTPRGPVQTLTETDGVAHAPAITSIDDGEYAIAWGRRYTDEDGLHVMRWHCSQSDD